MELKSSCKEAFKRKSLDCVKVGDLYVEHTVYKVIKPCDEKDFSFNIKTAENSNFVYEKLVIKETATSATLYTCVEKTTKTVLIELFSNLSINDIWCATFLKHDNDGNWQDELVTKIQSMKNNDAVKYVKKNFTTFGKSQRELAGQKITLKSANNYYMVRDLNIYFNELNTNGLKLAAKNSIRRLDVNTLQSLIFNGVKYVLK